MEKCTSREFTCANCHYTYCTDTTRAKREREFTKLYGHSVKDSDDEVVSICDECHAILIEMLYPETDDG